MTASETQITLSAERDLTLPSKESERLMGLRRFEWDRLRNRVSRLSKPIETASKWADRCFGAGGTLLVTFATLAGSNAKVESWVLPSALIGGVCLAVMGAVLHAIDDKLNAAQVDEATSICDEMDSILAAFEQAAEPAGTQPTE